MTKHLPSKAIVLTSILTLLLSSSIRTGAQPGDPSIVCLDTMVINARYVFVGKVVEIHDLTTRGANTNNVDVEIEDSLKGDERNRIQARIDFPVSQLQNWQALGSRLLIANGGGDATNTAIDLSAGDLMVLTADMQLLLDPEHVLQAARDAIDRHPGVYGIDTVPRLVPPEIAGLLSKFDAGCDWWSDCLITRVPADEDLERWAHRAVDSNRVWERAEAATALGYFRPTEANVAALRNLLNDPETIVTGTTDSQGHLAMAATLMGGQAKPANSPKLLCSEEKVICVPASVSNSLLSNPFRLDVTVNSPDSVELSWKIVDSKGQVLDASTPNEYWYESAGIPPPEKTLHIYGFIFKPATSRSGTLVLSPRRYIVKTGNIDLPEIKIPVRLTTASSIITTLAPEDREALKSAVAKWMDEEGHKTPEFDSTLKLIPRRTTIMRIDDRTDIVGATAEAMLRSFPGQEQWHVGGWAEEGSGTVHIKINGDGWTGVSSYWTEVQWLIRKSLLHISENRKVVFDPSESR